MSTTTLETAEDLDADERAAVEELLFRMADDEFVAAERYTEWQVHSPTLESDLAISNIAQDELGHGRLWFDALQEMGYTEPELVWERDPQEFTHSTLVELPFEDGDWAGLIVRTYLYDVAEHLRLEALRDGPYRPITDPLEKIFSEERYHREHAQNWLERLCDDAEGRAEVQDAVERLYPYALTLFVAGDHEDTIQEMGLRSESLDEIRSQWLDTTASFLEGLGVDVPFDPEDDLDAHLPENLGRDGDHTDDWSELYDDFTQTYRELERSDVRRLRGE